VSGSAASTFSTSVELAFCTAFTQRLKPMDGEEWKLNGFTFTLGYSRAMMAEAALKSFGVTEMSGGKPGT